jgi:hypothetical protein
MDSQLDPRPPRLAPNFSTMQQYSCYFVSLPWLSSRPSARAHNSSVSPDNASRSLHRNSKAFCQITRRHISEASAVRTSVFACFRNTYIHNLQPAMSLKQKSLLLILLQLPVVHPASDTSHQLHFAAPISSVADRDVSPLNPSHPSPTDTRTAGETSAFCIHLQDVIAPKEVTS